MKCDHFTTIHTDRLILRKLRDTDVQNYYSRLGSSQEVTRFMLWQPHKSLQESRESIRRILERDGYCWAIALKEDDSLIGRIDLLRIDEENRSCSFAYMLGKDFWNQGFGTEALQAVFSFAFTRLGMESIVADHMSENPASGRVMEKAGMRYVRTIRAKYEKCGKYYDAQEYCLTLDSWKEMQTGR